MKKTFSTSTAGNMEDEEEQEECFSKRGRQRMRHMLEEDWERVN